MSVVWCIALWCVVNDVERRTRPEMSVNVRHNLLIYALASYKFSARGRQMYEHLKNVITIIFKSDNADTLGRQPPLHPPLLLLRRVTKGLRFN